MGSYLESVNRTKVKAELLLEVLQMHAAMSPEDRPIFEARAFRIFELLKSRGLRSRQIAPLATAIHLRLEALVHLEQEDGLRGWSFRHQEPGLSFISMDAIKAAAEESLIEGFEGQASFHTESFRRRMLAGTEPDGRA